MKQVLMSCFLFCFAFFFLWGALLLVENWLAAGTHPWGLCIRYSGWWQSCCSKGSFVEMLAAAGCVNACVFASGSRSVSTGCWGEGWAGGGVLYGRERHIRTAWDPFGPLKYFFFSSSASRNRFDCRGFGRFHKEKLYKCRSYVNVFLMPSNRVKVIVSVHTVVLGGSWHSLKMFTRAMDWTNWMEWDNTSCWCSR